MKVLSRGGIFGAAGLTAVAVAGAVAMAGPAAADGAIQRGSAPTDAGVSGILGAKIPTPFHNGWRMFWTQQHGDNVTWEVHPKSVG